MYGQLLSALEAGATVVAANNRLARYLLRQYEDRQQAAGRRAWATPAIVTWGAWLQQRWAASRLEGGAATRLSYLSDERSAVIWELLVEAGRQRGIGAPAAELAHQARKSWRLLQDWEIEGAAEWDGFELTRDQRLFCGWFRAYRQRLDDAGLTDADGLAANLSPDLAAGIAVPTGPLHFVGFDRWPPARQRLLAALRAAGVEPEIHLPVVVAAEAQLVAAPCIEDEWRLAASWAREQLVAAPEASIAVIVHDLDAHAEEVSRVFLDVLAPAWRSGTSPASVPLNISYGRPLAEYPAVNALLRLLAMLAGTVEYGEFSVLLRSDWFTGARAEAGARALLDLELRESCRSRIRLRDVVGQCRRRAPRFAAMLDAVIAGTAGPPRRSPADWVAEITRLAELAGWPGGEAPGSETWQLVDAWQTLLAAFGDLGDETGQLTATEAADLLVRLASRRTFQARGPRRGVQVMGALEAAGQLFDAAWVTGMARELWPPANRPDPLLPIALQQRLQMPDSSAADTLDYARIVTARLRHCAARVVFSWPTRADEQALHPSPLPGTLAAVPASAGFPGWNDAVAAEAPAIVADDLPPPWPAGKRVPGGAGLFRMQALCPAVAFAERRLHVAEIRSPEPGLTAMERGNVVHDVLEAFYGEFPSTAALHAAGRPVWLPRLEALLQARLAKLDTGTDGFIRRLLELEQRQLLGRLDRFVTLDSERAPFCVETREQFMEVAVGALRVGLKVDRIDRLAAGGQLVIDYKTGSVKRSGWDPSRPPDLQLPLYATRFAEHPVGISFAQLSAGEVGFQGVGDGEGLPAGVGEPGSGKGRVQFRLPGTGEVITDWRTLLAAWERAIEELAGEFTAGDFRVDPANAEIAAGQFAPLTRIFDIDWQESDE